MTPSQERAEIARELASAARSLYLPTTNRKVAEQAARQLAKKHGRRVEVVTPTRGCEPQVRFASVPTTHGQRSDAERQRYTEALIASL